MNVKIYIQICLLQFVLLGCDVVFAQSVSELIEGGKKKNSTDGYGGIIDFRNAIKIDSLHPEANYEVGKWHVENLEFKLGLPYLTIAIESGKDYWEAYYIRALAYIQLNDSLNALRDLSVIVDNRPDFPEVLSLRAVVYFTIGEYELCCEDLDYAKIMNDLNADELIHKLCTDKYLKQETLILHFPKNEDWTESIHETQGRSLEQIFFKDKKGEGIDDWNEMLIMHRIHNAHISPITNAFDSARSLYYENMLGSEITVFEIDTLCEFPWVFFQVTGIIKEDLSRTISKLVYYKQGVTSFFINELTVQSNQLSRKRIRQWQKRFTNSKFEYL